MSGTFVKKHAVRDFGAGDFRPVLEGLSTDGYGVSEAEWRPRGGLAPRLHYFRKLFPIEFEERFKFRLWLDCHDFLILNPNLLE